MLINSRSAWGARSPRSVTTLSTGSLRGVAIHWFGSPKSPSTPDGVPAVIRSVQNGHMAPGGLGVPEGGSDIGYSFIVDRWGRIWTGRGWDVRPGATGPANGTHGAIVYAAGSGDPFTNEAKLAINWLIGEYRRRGAGNDVGWHSKFMLTDCPGDTIRAWIAAGRPVDKEQEEDLPLTDMDIQKVADAVWEHTFTAGRGTMRAKYHLGGTSLSAQTAVALLRDIADKVGADVDEQAVAAAVLQVLTPQAIAAALPEDIAGQVADEIAARLAG